MRIIILLATLFSLSAAPLVAAPPAKITIKTSAVCGMCKTAIEGALNQVPGVKSAVLDVTTRKVKVKYNSKQVTPAELRQSIAAAGYDADDVPALSRSYEALPGCCKKDSACAEGEEKGHGG